MATQTCDWFAANVLALYNIVTVLLSLAKTIHQPWLCYQYFGTEHYLSDENVQRANMYSTIMCVLAQVLSLPRWKTLERRHSKEVLYTDALSNWYVSTTFGCSAISEFMFVSLNSSAFSVEQHALLFVSVDCMCNLFLQVKRFIADKKQTGCDLLVIMHNISSL